MTELTENRLYPLHTFRFHVDFQEQILNAKEGGAMALCSGAFSECSGLEATMEPKEIKEGGHNWGVNHRAGQITFATVVLKRGMTTTRDLWTWFSFVGQGKYAHRLNATISIFDNSGKGVIAWKLINAMPVKFKAADMNAKNSDIAVEELHIVHEGMFLTSNVKPKL